MKGYIKNIIMVSIIIISGTTLSGQTVTGQFTEQAGQTLSLQGFDYSKTTELASVVIDGTGKFTLTYPKNYVGIGVLTAQNSNLFLMLGAENITIKGKHLANQNSLKYLSGEQNIKLVNYSKAQSLRLNVKSAWDYLKPIYSNEKMLSNQQQVIHVITNELQRLETENWEAVNAFNKDSFLYWFIPVRQLVNDMAVNLGGNTEHIRDNIKRFRKLDFTNPNFKTSGVFNNLVEGHYSVIQKLKKPIDSIYNEMNKSTDHIISTLEGDSEILNTVGTVLFNYFEKNSLLQPSEHLAMALLTNNKCSINNDLINKLEGYRKLKVGNIAPDIQLNASQKLSDLKRSVVLVFGASWCPNCKEELPKLKAYYDIWKSKNIEIIYISLDTDAKAFSQTYSKRAWSSYCDFMGWDGKAAQDYHVFSTPSYFILGENLEILEKPRHAEHANAWIKHEFFMKTEN